MDAGPLVPWHGPMQQLSALVHDKSSDSRVARTLFLSPVDDFALRGSPLPNRQWVFSAPSSPGGRARHDGALIGD